MVIRGLLLEVEHSDLWATELELIMIHSISSFHPNQAALTLVSPRRPSESPSHVTRQYCCAAAKEFRPFEGTDDGAAYILELTHLLGTHEVPVHSGLAN